MNRQLKRVQARLCKARLMLDDRAEADEHTETVMQNDESAGKKWRVQEEGLSAVQRNMASAPDNGSAGNAGRNGMQPAWGKADQQRGRADELQKAWENASDAAMRLTEEMGDADSAAGNSRENMLYTMDDWQSGRADMAFMPEDEPEWFESGRATEQQEAGGQAVSIDYDRLAEATARRPVVVYVDKKAAAVLLTREMDTAIGNRNIRQLTSMGG